MSTTTTILNKKGQYYPKPSYSNIHPLLIVGIVVFCIPFLLPVIQMHAPGWLETTCSVCGIGGIIIGAGISIFNAS